MWFISILAIIAILWFLYVIAQNTSESLDNQRELLRELKDLRSVFQDLTKNQSTSPPAEEKLISSNETSQKANVGVSSPSSSDSSTSHSGTSNLSPSYEENNSESAALINMNTAELNELQSLPGVGKVVAQKIIDARPFESIESLAAVPGVSVELLNKLKSRVTI